MSSTTKPAEVWAISMIMKYTWGDHTLQEPETEIYATYEAAKARAEDPGRIARDYSCGSWLTDNGIPINAEILDWHISAKKIRGLKEVA